MTILSNAANSTLTAALSGNGTQVQQAQLSSNPASLSFGSMNAGSSATQTLTLTITGNAAANISQITVSATGFLLSGITAPLVLAAGGAISFQVTFSPTAVGAYIGNVMITSDAANSSLPVSLSGTATHTVTLSWTDGGSGSPATTYIELIKAAGHILRSTAHSLDKPSGLMPAYSPDIPIIMS